MAMSAIAVTFCFWFRVMHISHLLVLYYMQAITAVVQKVMEYIDVTPDVETRIELIKTLSSVAAGKVRRMATSYCLLL